VLHNPFDFAGEGPPFDAAAAPLTVVLTADRKRLRLSWQNGKSAELSGVQLRDACRCAWCTRARHDGTFAPASDDIEIEQRMSLIREESLKAMGGEISDGALQGLSIDLRGRSLAEVL
jgi:Gamma-butyrobetaine hydroxylase-like, N-terminal